MSNKVYMILVARMGDVNISLPIPFQDNISCQIKNYKLIDGTYVYGNHSADGVFIIRMFDPKSEIMKNVIKCMSAVTCYDFSKLTDAPEPSEDDNMEVARILRPASEIKMWRK